MFGGELGIGIHVGFVDEPGQIIAGQIGPYLTAMFAKRHARQQRRRIGPRDHVVNSDELERFHQDEAGHVGIRSGSMRWHRQSVVELDAEEISKALVAVARTTRPETASNLQGADPRCLAARKEILLKTRVVGNEGGRESLHQLTEADFDRRRADEIGVADVMYRAGIRRHRAARVDQQSLRFSDRPLHQSRRRIGITTDEIAPTDFAHARVGRHASRFKINKAKAHQTVSNDARSCLSHSVRLRARSISLVRSLWLRTKASASRLSWSWRHVAPSSSAGIAGA